MIRELRFSGSRKIFARVLQDLDDPKLYRIHWPDGGVSDRCSLTRACDKAVRSVGPRWVKGSVLERPYWIVREAAAESSMAAEQEGQLG